jgi:hypothetical protein
VARYIDEAKTVVKASRVSAKAYKQIVRAAVIANVIIALSDPKLGLV